ncbi:MFS transporter [Actinomadura sp. B10D3]|uniref:MFS transporter n=1 Tax=Actinomadura sp. B10D3 TaxID=3153557 RepID=UPI00325C81A3
MNRDFRKLWAGQTASLFGSQVTELALPLTAVISLHATAAQVGLLGTARWLPWALLALWAGAWIDRKRRLPVLIAADAVRAVLLAGIVVLAVLDLLTVPLLLAAVFAFGTATVLFEVSYQSYVPSIVTPAQLVGANSRLTASQSTAQVGGPGVGGVLVQLMTAPITLVVDAVTFALSALSLLLIRTREPLPEPPATRKGQIREGLRVTLGNPLLRALIGTAASYNLFSNWMVVLFPLFAIRVLGLGAGAIGLILSTGAIGALAGSILASPVTRRLGVGRAVLWPIVIEVLALMLVPLAPAGSAVTIPLLVTAFLFNGMGVALSSVVATSVRQAVTPPPMLGRMTATYRTISFGVVAVGTFLGGLAGEWLGLRTGVAVGATGLVTSVIWVAASPLRRMREIPAPQDSWARQASSGDASCRPDSVERTAS